MSLAEASAANWPEWWDKNSYGYTAHLTRRDWASRFFCRALPAVAEQVSPSSAAPPFDLAALPRRATVLLLGDGCQHVLLRRADRHLQLVVYGANVLLSLRLHSTQSGPLRS